MSNLTPRANELLREYQAYAKDGYRASQMEWARFGARAVSAIYQAERQLMAEEEQARGRNGAIIVALRKLRSGNWRGAEDILQEAYYGMSVYEKTEFD